MRPANNSHIVRATRALLTLLVVGLCAAVGIHISFQVAITRLDNALENERVHLFISEQMVLSVQQAELLVYQMAPAGKPEVYQRNIQDIDYLARALGVLVRTMLEGGVTREVLSGLANAPQSTLRDRVYAPDKHLQPMAELEGRIASLTARLKADARALSELLRERDRCQQQQLPCAPQSVAAVREMYRDFPGLFGPLRILVLEHHNAIAGKVHRAEIESREQRILLQRWRYALVAGLALTFLLYVISITRRIRATERQLLDVSDAATSASQEKTNFLATMSHEIRTPMNGVIGFTELLLATRLGAEQRELANGISNAAESLLVLVNDILDLSRVEAGALDFEQRPFVVADLIRSVASVFEVQARNKQIRLAVDPGDRTAGVRIGDRGRIRQVLLNLLSNAVKFTEQGEVRVAVSSVPTGLRFEVRDTGIGVAGDVQQRIFGTYKQADASTSHRYGGTGLGLAICKGLVEAMGGTIGVASVPGQGSCFWFELPLVPGELPEAADSDPEVLPLPDGAPPAEQAAHRNMADHPGEGNAILLVEDTPTNQVVASAMLRKMGCRVDVVASGVEAIEAVQKNTYALVFMDLQMPGLDGIETTRRIRALAHPAAAVCIVAMTANAMQSDRDACIGAGMNDFVSKPITMDRVANCLTRWLPRS